MCTCTNQRYYFITDILFPYKKKVVHYMAFITIFEVTFECMGFIFCRSAAKSCIHQFSNKMFKSLKILLGTLFKFFQIFLKLSCILKGIHLNTVKKGFCTISFKHLSFTGIINSLTGNSVRAFLNMDKTIITGVILQKFNKTFRLIIMFVYVNYIRCHTIFLQKYKNYTRATIK